MHHSRQIPASGQVPLLLSLNHPTQLKKLSSHLLQLREGWDGHFTFSQQGWISAQQGICSRDVNSNLYCALTDLSSSLSDNIPKCKKLGTDSLIRL